jgi:UDP-N-acetylglucosamine acyltransferase
VAGYPLKVVGLNSTGLRRRGFGSKEIRELERAFKILFFSKLNTTQAVERLKDELEPNPQLQVILDFLERSDRGIVK